MRSRIILMGLILSLAPVLASAQPTEIQPVDFMLRGVVDANGVGSVDHARIIVSRSDDGTVLVDRAFTDATGNYATVFQANTEVPLGLGDPPLEDPPIVQITESWMGAAWPNPIRGSGDLSLTLPYSAPEGAQGPPALDVFDARGRRIDPGQSVASGVYFYRLRFGVRFAAARKLMVLGRGELRFQLQQVGTTPGIDVSDVRTGTADGAAKRGEGTVLVDIRVEKFGFVTQQQTLLLDSTLDNTASFVLDAEATPTANLSIGGTLQVGEAVLFDASSSSGATDYAWNFGDQQRGGGEFVAHVFAIPGQYTISLTVAAQYGATASASTTIDVVQGPPPVSSGAMVVGSITDAVGNLLEGVTATHVTSGVSATSLSDGSVTLTNMPTGVPLVLELSKENYTLQTVRMVLPANNEFSSFEASLRRRRVPVTLNKVEDGGLSESEDGACVILPPDALMRPDGSMATGEATVCITPVDVSNRTELAAFPGSFEGIRPTGERGLLLTYGVMEVTFEQGGERLQLVPGRCAEIEIPSYSASASLGDTIDLWSVDPTTGLWLQEGQGTVVASPGSPTGMALRAQVTHFSWWNMDHFEGNPRPLRPRCKLRDVGGFPVIDIPGGESCYIDSELLDEDGPFTGPGGPVPPEGEEQPFPPGVGITLTGSSANGSLRGSVTIGPGSAKGVEDVIIPLDPIAAGGGHLIFPTSVVASIDPAGEVDVYTFDGQAEQYISLLTQPSLASNLEGTMTLIDPNGAVIFAIDFDDETTATTHKLEADGEYRLEIAGTLNAPGAYELNARFIESFDMQLPSTIVSDLEPERVNKIELNVPANTWFTMNFRRLNGTGSGAQLRIEDSLGNVVRDQYMGSTRFSTQPLQLSASGPHCVTITSLGFDGEYEFAVRDVPTILPGAIIENTGKDGTYHYYQFQGSAGDLFKGSLDELDLFSGQIAIIDTEGDVPPSAMPPVIFNNSTAIHSLESTGTHFLMVWSSTNDDPQLARPYRAGLNVVPPPLALSFDSAGRATRTPQVARFGDIRVFSFEGNEGDGVEIQMLKNAASTIGTSGVFRMYRVGTGTPRIPQLQVNHFGANGRFFGDEDAGVHEAAFFRLPADDTYVFLVSANSPEVGRFELIVDVVESSSNVTVDDDLIQNPNADTRSLQAALIGTIANGTITVEAGTYTAPGTFWAADTVTLQGAGLDQTTLTSATFNTVLRSEVGFDALRDLRLHAPIGSSHKPAVLRGATSMLIERVAMSLDPGVDRTLLGIEIVSSVGTTVRDCVLSDSWKALSIDSCQDMVIEGNTFTNSTNMVAVNRSTGIQIRGNQWTQDELGTAIQITNCTGTTVEDNDIVIATGETGGNGLDWAIAIQDRDDAGDQPGSVVRGNRIETDEAGIWAEVFFGGSAVVVESNFVVGTSEAGRKALEVTSRQNGPGLTMLIQNNVFEGTTSFGGMYLRDVEHFESFRVINNTLRTSQNVVAPPSQFAIGVVTDANVPGPLPVLLINNVLVGNGGTGIDIPINTTIDSNYNLLHGFSSNYAGGSTSTGTNDLTADPMFTGAELRLDPNSPAVDSGATSSEVPQVPSEDFSGNARPLGNGVDRGAHEQ